MPSTQVQLSSAFADRAGISRAEAKRVLGALEEVVLEERCRSGSSTLADAVSIEARSPRQRRARANQRRARSKLR